MTTTIVITFSEYEPDAELLIVRLYAGFVLDTITRGYSSVKMDSTVRAMATVVDANAQPTEFSVASQVAANTASTAAISTGLGSTPLPELTCVQMAKPSTSSPVTGAARWASLVACCRRPPVVFRPRNVLPCSTHSAT